jgi:hypothetical protein
LAIQGKKIFRKNMVYYKTLDLQHWTPQTLMFSSLLDLLSISQGLFKSLVVCIKERGTELPVKGCNHTWKIWIFNSKGVPAPPP